MIQRILIIIIGYLIGSFQTAILIGRTKGIDIRNHGSGNAGATNTLRVLGKKSAIIVFVGDMLKTVIAVIIVGLLFKEPLMPYLITSIYAGLGAVLGHNWPIYFRFKGGKGIAVSVATLLMLDYRIGLIGAAIFLTCVFITRYVSLSSILLTLSAPIFLMVFYSQASYFTEAIVVVTVIPALAIYRHLPNIKRLLNGTEAKIGQKKE